MPNTFQSKSPLLSAVSKILKQRIENSMVAHVISCHQKAGKLTSFMGGCPPDRCD